MYLFIRKTSLNFGNDPYLEQIRLSIGLQSLYALVSDDLRCVEWAIKPCETPTLVSDIPACITGHEHCIILFL